MTPSLPLDIICLIIEYLEDDLTALRHCALTSSALLPPSRTRLYQHIAFACPDPATHKVQLFCRTILEHSELGAFTRSLTIAELRSSARTNVVVTRNLLPFHLLVNLRVLTLFWAPLQAHELLKIVSWLPQLKQLVCDFCLDVLPEDSVPDWIGPLGQAEPATFPRFRELVIRQGSWDHESFAQRLMRDQPQSIERLLAIDLDLPGFEISATLPWLVVVRGASAHLKSIGISVMDLTHILEHGVLIGFPEPYRVQYQWIMDSVATCSALRSMRLRYEPSLLPSNTSSSSFLESACEVLERHPPPFPLFESLELCMVDREGRLVSVTKELCARLAGCLLDKRRFPSFSKLVLHVQQQFWAHHSGMWSSWKRRERSGDEEEALLSRWRAMFDVFEQAPGVVLHVDVLPPPPGPQFKW
ncbi:hypothetical protein BV20DRAFT_1057999 [Pilatotrama ljubarskyi]|nr:hypothetical protein BV20DRAFT_1057999 [Pilatotrama ljubarskyi]